MEKVLSRKKNVITIKNHEKKPIFEEPQSAELKEKDTRGCTVCDAPASP